MPISHDLKTIFIHIPKCAGESMEKSLGMFGLVNGSAWGNYWGIVNTNVALQHLTICEIELLLKQQEDGQEIIDNYFKFAFVRNPWDRTVSEYHWYLKRSPKCSFDEWCEGLESRIKLNTMISIYEIGHNIPQHKFICDDGDNIKVDFCGRFENLESDFKKVCDILNKPVKLSHSKNTAAKERKNYRDYFGTKTKTIIKRIYEKDIDIFKYTF